MKPSEEIKRYSLETDKPILLWLISHYHMSSNWPFVAKCSFSPEKYPNNHRVWTPTSEGLILYNNRIELETLKASKC